ncbi:MAG: CDP-alcohol phosphatidyltransferase family protein [Acidobacteria bacterium]|nr:CDP-alcohol phosphatidyltransferase family protein [Acidobacteriota bacterium]
MLKLKDLVTLGSLLLALYSVEQAFSGRTERAAVMVLLAWGFDAIDGLVARLTRSGNAFGANLDDLVDHVAYTVAPAFIVFNVYAPGGWALAFALLFTVVAVGTIRLAGFATTPLGYPGYWIGLPRPALGFNLVFFLNSSVFAMPGGRLAGAALVAVMGGLSLTRLPYRNHKKPFRRAHVVLLVGTLLGCIALYPVGQMWNGALVLGTIYLFAPWLTLSARGRAEISKALASTA